jgi:hypothetical protein
MKRVFGRPVSGSVSESSCVRSYTIALLITAAGLLADAIEQPAMIFLIEARSRVMHRQRSDHAILEDQRTDER